MFIGNQFITLFKLIQEKKIEYNKLLKNIITCSQTRGVKTLFKKKHYYEPSSMIDNLIFIQ